MSTRLAGSASRIRRGIAIAAGLISVSGLAVFATGADAAPQPTVSQVQAKINQLTTQFDKVSQQLDQASQQLSAAQTKLSQVRVRLRHANAQFQTAQANVAATAAAAFEDSGATSIAGVLTSGDPSVLLQQGSLLMELSGNRSAQTRQLLTDASQLAGVEQEMSRTEAGIAGLKRQLASHRSSLGKLIDTQKATLASLTVPQRQAVTDTRSAPTAAPRPSSTPGPPRPRRRRRSRSPTPSSAARTCTAARGRASAGMTAPAWPRPPGQRPACRYRATATRSGPRFRTSPSPLIEPGDLLIYNGEGHVAIYVGGGYIIDAPQTGMNVQKIPESTSWYASNLDGALRP